MKLPDGWQWDAFTLAGGLSVIYGLLAIWPPLAFLGGGLLLIAIGAVGAKRWAS
jgi:hypothetical protein